MPVQLVTLPESSALTLGGRMIFQFQGTGRTITTGTAAVMVFIVTAAVTNGYTLNVRWKGQTATIVFKSAPLEPNEFPTGDGSAAYVDQLAEQFAEYFPFYEDFIVERSDEAISPGIKFTAREPGAKYTISLGTLPDSAPIKLGFALGVITDGADALLRTEYSIYAELWIQKDQTEGLTQADFRKVAPITIRTDASGLARWDVGAILHSELTPDSPNWNLPIAKRSFNSHKKYFIRYAEAWGSPIRNSRVKTDVTRHAYFGGVSYEERASGGFQLSNYVQPGTAAQDQALRYGSKTRYVRLDEPQFLSFINLRAAVSASLEVTLKFSDSTSLIITNLIPAFDFGLNEKWSTPVGIGQLSLLSKVPAGKSLVEYQVRLCQTGTSSYLSAPYRYIVNGRHEPYTRYFAFINSLGAIDTLATFGKGSSELTRYYEQAEKFLPAFYTIEHGQLLDHNISIQRQLEVTTGYCSQKELERWQDFYVSATRYHLADGKALPISISSKTIKEAKDGDTTFSNVFQFAYLFKDDFYTYVGDAELEGDTEPPLGFVPGGDVTITVPTVVNARDPSVPDIVRTLTPEQIGKFVLKASEPNPETLGFLRQAQVDQLYYPKSSKIDFQKDLINTPKTRDEAGLSDVPTYDEVDDRIGQQAPTRTIQETALASVLSEPQYASEGPLVTIDTPGGRSVGYMTWLRNASYVAVNMSKEYIALLLHNGREFLGLNNILENNNESGQNIRLTGTGNLILDRLLGQGAVDRFVYWRKQLADKSFEFLGGMGLTSNGYVGIALGKTLKLVLEIREDIAIWRSPVIAANDSIVQAAEYRNTKLLPADKQVVGAIVLQENTVTGIWEQRYVPLSMLGGTGAGFSEALMPYIAQWIYADMERESGGVRYVKPIFPTTSPTSPSVPLFRTVHYSEGVVVVSRYITSLNYDLPESGGWIGVLQEQIGDGTERQSTSVVAYSIPNKPGYVTISQPAELSRAHVKLVLAANSITQNEYVLLQASIGGVVVAQQRIRLVNSDSATCARPGGLQTFTFAYNFVAQGAGVATPLTWDNSDAIVVGLYNNSQPGRWGQDIYVQAESLVVGKSVFAGLTTACDKIDGRVFYVRDASAQNTVNKIVETDVNGTILRIKTPTVMVADDTVGTVEELDCAGYKGWNLNRNNGAQLREVELVLLGMLANGKHTGGTVIATVSTGLDRPDIAQIVNPAATKSGFGGFIPDALKNGTNLVYFRDKLTGTNLNGSPLSLTCGVVAKSYTARGPAQLTEGGPAGQFRLVETISGQEQISSDARAYRLGAGTPAGISISATGEVSISLGSIVADLVVYVFIKPAGAEEVYTTFTAKNVDPAPANRAPVLVDAMPDVPIYTADQYQFALPDGQFSDPDGDTLTLTMTQIDGSALPAWLSFNSATRTFTKAAGFGSGSVGLRTTATDPGGLSATNDFLVTVASSAVRIMRVDVEFIRNTGSPNKLRIWTKATGAPTAITTQFNTASNPALRIIGNQPVVGQSDGYTHYREYNAIDGIDNTPMAGTIYLLLGPVDPVTGSVNQAGNASFSYSIPLSGSSARQPVYIAT